MHAHYFQHVPFEGLGSIERWLGEHGYEISVTRWHAGDMPPAPSSIDLLIVMGGPMSINDTSAYPWLTTEMDYIRRWIERDRPLLGVCLGAQLIASALGVSVHPNPVKEIGWFPVMAANPLPDYAFQFPEIENVFHWHGETFDLPPNAIRLASSKACNNQAFQIGRHVMGLQFHLETTPKSADTLITNCRDELIPDLYVQDETTLLTTPPEAYHAINVLMAELLDYLVSA